MTRFVVLLRGVNVGRGNRVPMADFRLILESLGHTHVKTLLNSGNAVFTSQSSLSAPLAPPLHDALVANLGISVLVIVKSRQEMDAIEAQNALAANAADPSRLLVAFTQEPHSLDDLKAVLPLVQPPEQALIGQQAAYFLCANGILESKAAKALLGKVGRAVTTRNWATVLKINTLLKDQGDV